MPEGIRFPDRGANRGRVSERPSDGSLKSHVDERAANDGNHIMEMTATRYTYILAGFSNSLTERVRDKALYSRCKGTETKQKKKRQNCEVVSSEGWQSDTRRRMNKSTLRGKALSVFTGCFPEQ